MRMMTKRCIYIDDFLDLFYVASAGQDKMFVKVVEQVVEDTPTADVVEVKYGYWEIVKGSNGKEKMVCTNCRHQQDLHSTFTYCPNCGALIDGRAIHNG